MKLIITDNLFRLVCLAVIMKMAPVFLNKLLQHTKLIYI